MNRNLPLEHVPVMHQSTHNNGACNSPADVTSIILPSFSLTIPENQLTPESEPESSCSESAAGFAFDTGVPMSCTCIIWFFFLFDMILWLLWSCGVLKGSKRKSVVFFFFFFRFFFFFPFSLFFLPLLLFKFAVECLGSLQQRELLPQPLI